MFYVWGATSACLQNGIRTREMVGRHFPITGPTHLLYFTLALLHVVLSSRLPPKKAA